MRSLLLILFLSISAFSGVNLKNGNFYMSYTDIVSTSKGVTLELTRTYNSKSTHLGWFGYGWGTPFETRLETISDGSVVIYENGSGGESRFVPKGGVSPVTVRKNAKDIIAKVQEKSKLSSKAMNLMYKRLVNDNNYRKVMSAQVGVTLDHKAGTVLHSFDYGKQALQISDKGYKRVFNSGFVQYFNRDGDLIASADKTGYRIRLERDKVSKRVKKIFDNKGNQILFSWTSNGYIKNLNSIGDGSASFTYRGKDLVTSKDVNANKYTFTYDSYHNLTAIKDHQVKNKSESTLKVTYAPKTFFTTSVSKRDGNVTKYTYKSDPKNKDLHYWTVVEKAGINGQRYANKFEYEHKKRSDGSKWLYRTKFVTAGDYKRGKVIGGTTRETYNNECCELPIKIVQGSKVTNFAYKDGLMVRKKSSDGSFSKVEYDQRTKKISKVTNNQGWITYAYNKKGELKTARDNKGRAVNLIYDMNGKITKMVDQDQAKSKRVISFEYNSLGKPSQISMAGVGKLVVGYDSFGQVKKVDSSGGRQIASQVSGAFQKLLSIVKPAGVNLSL